MRVVHVKQKKKKLYMRTETKQQMPLVNEENNYPIWAGLFLKYVSQMLHMKMITNYPYDQKMNLKLTKIQQSHFQEHVLCQIKLIVEYYKINAKN